jgi:sarcosine oxidase subunit beta
MARRDLSRGDAKDCQASSSSEAVSSAAASPISSRVAACADVVVLERETVGSGTTSKAAGGIRGQFSTETEIRFSLESLEVLNASRRSFGVDPGFKQIGICSS